MELASKLDSLDPFTDEINSRDIRVGNKVITTEEVQAALDYIAHAPPLFDYGSGGVWLLVTSWVRAVMTLDRLNWAWLPSPSTIALGDDALIRNQILSGNRSGIVC